MDLDLPSRPPDSICHCTAVAYCLDFVGHINWDLVADLLQDDAIRFPNDLTL